MSLKFKPTHRMLVRATENSYGYDTVDIDINNGTFKRTIVKASETKIRVNKSILGEILNPHKPLGLNEIDGVAKQFNEARVAAGYSALVFRTEDEDRTTALKELAKIDASLSQKTRDLTSGIDCSEYFEDINLE